MGWEGEGCVLVCLCELRERLDQSTLYICMTVSLWNPILCRMNVCNKDLGIYAKSSMSENIIDKGHQSNFSVVKSICCSRTGLVCLSTPTSGGLQLSITLDPGDMMPPSPGLCGDKHACGATRDAGMYTHVYTINFKWKDQATMELT